MKVCECRDTLTCVECLGDTNRRLAKLEGIVDAIRELLKGV